MNSDGPTLPIEHVRQTIEVLIDSGDVVLGPSDDGGYALLTWRMKNAYAWRCCHRGMMWTIDLR